MIVVASFAAKLCDRFIKKGYLINKDLVIEAALLHDVLRVVDFKNFSLASIKQRIKSDDLITWIELKEEFGHLGHEKAIAKVLKKDGLKEVANLIEKHNFFEIDNLKTWEEKIVYYADKRVDRSTIVSLKKRMSEGKKRNFSSKDDLQKVEQVERKVLKLEKEIKKALRLSVFL
ncbi:MAG TPA: HD domain-containing protein [Candidatus Gracilibacteria bacterium]|nr:HD domain-containing protein [Candidatus Gracilibacteria bacterium]